MVEIPAAYPPAQDIPIPVFQFTDIAAGTGVVTYFGAASKDPTIGYMLSEQQVYTAQRETARVTGTGESTFNFDLTAFNLPRTAKGTAVFSCPVWNLTQANTTTIKVKIIKVSGGTPSDVSSQISAEGLSNVGQAKMILIKIPLTETHFKKKDILRCEVVLNTSGDPGAFGHSPNNIKGEARFTAAIIADNNLVMIMKLNMSYRIDS